MAANALPGVLHAIAQRRPTAHFRAGDDTAELRLSTRESDGASLARKLVGGSVRKALILSYGLSYEYPLVIGNNAYA